jgi:hypothetical protein
MEVPAADERGLVGGSVVAIAVLRRHLAAQCLGERSELMASVVARIERYGRRALIGAGLVVLYTVVFSRGLPWG